MESVYLLETDDDFVRQESLNRFLSSLNQYEIVKYNGEDTSWQRVLEDLNTYNFLVEHKCIVFENAPVNTISDADWKSLEQYLNHPSTDNILVLVVTKLDKRKKSNDVLVKLTKALATKIDIKDLVRKSCEEYQITPRTISYLIDYCLGDNEKIMTELEKLKLYCYDSKEITTNDIDEIVTKSLDDDIFTLVDAIMTNKKAKAIELYQDMLLHGGDAKQILSLVANQFTLYYQTRVLRQDGYSSPDIAKELGIHPYRVQLALEKTYRYTDSELLKKISKLAELDYESKIGKQNVEDGFLLFFLAL